MLDVELQVARLNAAANNCGKGPKGHRSVRVVTAAEYRQFRKMLLAAKLFPYRGVEGLYETRKRGLREPPNFAQYMPKARFQHILRFCPYAHADDANVAIAADIEGGARASWGMGHHRRADKRDRLLTKERTKTLIADERMLNHEPRTTKDGGVPTVHEPRKPDKNGVLTINAADPEQWIEVGQEERRDPQTMLDELEWGKVYDPHIAATLRLMKDAGANKDNVGNFFGDAWFASMGVVEAAHKHFPGWSITGIVKNNSAGFPKAFLDDYCESRSNRIRRAGFTAYLSYKTVSGIEVMACAHKRTQESTTMMITTAGSCNLGKQYTQTFMADDGLGRVQKQVDRGEVFGEYFDVSGTIDHINRQAAFELRLWDCWAPRKFWRKYFISQEGLIFTDMYLMYRANRRVESAQGTGLIETLKEFLDRVMGSILPQWDQVHRNGNTLGVPSPQPTRPGSPIFLQSPSSPNAKNRGSRGTKRAAVDLDGDHAPDSEVVEMKRRKSGSGSAYPKNVRKTCSVCKQRGIRMNDKNRTFPQTMMRCRHCNAHVHGRNEPGYPACWHYHLHNKVKGMSNSGDMGADPAEESDYGSAPPSRRNSGL